MLLPPQFRRDDDFFGLGEKILPKKEEQVCKFKEFETKNYDTPLTNRIVEEIDFYMNRIVSRTLLGPSRTLGVKWSSPEATVGETYKSNVFGDFRGRHPMSLYMEALANDQRWPEAELYIMEDVYAAIMYAKNVIRGRWPEAEPYIMQNEVMWKSYQIMWKSYRLRNIFPALLQEK